MEGGKGCYLHIATSLTPLDFFRVHNLQFLLRPSSQASAWWEEEEGVSFTFAEEAATGASVGCLRILMYPDNIGGTSQCPPRTGSLPGASIFYGRVVLSS